MRRTIFTSTAIAFAVVLVAVILNHSKKPAVEDRSVSVVMAKEEKSCPFCANEPKQFPTSQTGNSLSFDEARAPAVRSAITSFIDKTKYALRLDSVDCTKSICVAQVSTTMIIDDHGIPFYQSLMFKDFLEPAHVSSLEASTTAIEEGMKRYELTLHISDPV